MNKGKQPEFLCDPEIERTFLKRNKENQKRRQHNKNKTMGDQQNNHATNIADNALAQTKAHPILLTHDRSRPIREYTSPNLYDFLSGIMRLMFEGAKFKMKSVIFQMI